MTGKEGKAGLCMHKDFLNSLRNYPPVLMTVSDMSGISHMIEWQPALSQ